MPLSDYTHDLDAIAEAIFAAHATRLPGKPEQSHRDDFSPRQVGKFLANVAREVLLIVDGAYFEYVERRWLSRIRSNITNRIAPCSRSGRFPSFLRSGRLARRLRRGAQGIDRDDAACAPTL